MDGTASVAAFPLDHPGKPVSLYDYAPVLHPVRPAHWLRVAAPATRFSDLAHHYRWFLRLSKVGVFERLAHALTMADRERSGCKASPTGAILDRQAARFAL
ncbi:hypothetical protein SAMN05192565_111107 [Methylobacterium gossipiicola]|uniref:Uncharacterized protein n=1 Tax=Methylobacterium gossipiicola TaxID=582675 RepID=A0A1I2UX39_9HYPH|nr:hypothetical protein SAMN05192565_111107 [Methylobacterium gossipiicola]